MRYIGETDHTLEIKNPSDLTYIRATAKMYQPAMLLAHQGRLTEAIDEAEEIRIREWGNMIGVSFRVVTTTRMVTFKGPFEDAGPLT